MGRRIGSLAFIFVCTTIAWIILGSATSYRTHSQDMKLKGLVGQLWGTIQNQQAPFVYYQTTKEKKIKTIRGDETIFETVVETTNHLITLESSDIDVKFDLDHRKKGLLWYSTYVVSFTGKYLVMNTTNKVRDILFEYTFPTTDGVYDDFLFSIAGEEIKDIKPTYGKIIKSLQLNPGESKKVEISYQSQGMDEWWYTFGYGVSQIKNFRLTMHTDFDNIDFPANSISPTGKEETDDGWKLIWQYSNLISGIQIGMDMPAKLNPGPFASRVSFYAPVSLFLFLFLMFIITIVKEIKIHPMNYFFISAAFFSFHLLLAYLVDHLDISLAFAISSVVSIFLVISYMKLVVGRRFAFLEIGISQFVYLVIFSFVFFLEGYTGLAVTILCILTLFLVMQFTGRIDWDKQFVKDKNQA